MKVSRRTFQKCQVGGWMFILVAACSPATPAPQGQPIDGLSAAPEATAQPLEVGSVASVLPMAPRVDPACMLSVAWFSDPQADDIKLSGCRAAAALAPRDEDGWRSFQSDQGETIRTRDEIFDPETGNLSFVVLYNGGGTLSGKYKVTGKPDGNNVLKVGQFNILPLN